VYVCLGDLVFAHHRHATTEKVSTQYHHWADGKSPKIPRSSRRHQKAVVRSTWGALSIFLLLFCAAKKVAKKARAWYKNLLKFFTSQRESRELALPTVGSNSTAYYRAALAQILRFL